MVGTYPIILGKEVIGTATVRKSGLYYIFDCRCILQKVGICRVMALCGKTSVNLGVCVPNGNTYTTTAKIPVSKLTGNEISFSVVSPLENMDEIVLLDPYTPISNLEILRECRFFTNGKQMYLVQTVTERM